MTNSRNTPNVSAIRRRIGCTQAEFAALIGVKLGAGAAATLPRSGLTTNALSPRNFDIVARRGK
jgi:hypothetical protein